MESLMLNGVRCLEKKMKIKVGAQVRHTGCETPHRGKVVAARHTRDEYVVVWYQNGRRWTGKHSRMALREVR